MNKPSKKRPTYDSSVLEILIERYGLTRRYIRMSIDGTRTGIIPLKVAEEYKKIVSEKKIAEAKAIKNL